MTGNKQALQIVLNNDRDPGCTEKLAMTRAWGERYTAEATAYMERKAYHYKRQFWATRISLRVDASRNWSDYPEDDEEIDFYWNKEKGLFQCEVYIGPGFTETRILEKDPMDQPPASEANKWEKEAHDIAEKYNKKMAETQDVSNLEFISAQDQEDYDAESMFLHNYTHELGQWYEEKEK